MSSAERVIDLAELANEIVLAEFNFAKCACEKAAIVASLLKVDQIRSWNGSFGEDHQWALDVRLQLKRHGSIGQGDPLKFGAGRIDLPSNPCCQNRAALACDKAHPFRKQDCTGA